ncbi:hypothetical protein ACR30L_12155 [Psychromonas sp. PT13]|uniref:hypothetical protein n=1 Tax=Psychromonas sp. PT13 TaxID=3439547 RepID=UPI003EBD8768
MNKFTVVWIPDNQNTPATCEEVLNIGGRIIDEQLSKRDAEKVERCLKINGEQLPGDYITLLVIQSEHKKQAVTK